MAVITTNLTAIRHFCSVTTYHKAKQILAPCMNSLDHRLIVELLSCGLLLDRNISFLLATTRLLLGRALSIFIALASSLGFSLALAGRLGLLGRGSGLAIGTSRSSSDGLTVLDLLDVVLVLLLQTPEELLAGDD